MNRQVAIQNIADGKFKHCNFCSVAPNPLTPFKTCGRCKVPAYCSKECQHKHWPKDKTLCVPIPTFLPKEAGFDKLNKWHRRNVMGLGMLSKLIITPANAAKNLLWIQIAFNDTADNLRMFQIEQLCMKSLEEMDELYSEMPEESRKASWESVAAQCQAATNSTLDEAVPGTVYHYLYFVTNTRTSHVLCNIVSIRANEDLPRYNNVDYYVNAINNGEGGLIDLNCRLLN